jgi:predicted branched-subunit amino acid permease
MRAGTPYAIAAGLVGVSFGVVAEPVMGAGAAIIFSAVVFAGAAQFASTSVLAAGGGAVAAIIAGILLNLRYGPMGVALAPSVHGHPVRRAAIGQAMIDASWAMASRGGGRFDPAFMVGATLPSYPVWIAGTALGALVGDVIGDPAAFGLDALFPAFFLTLLVTELRRPGGKGAAAIGAIVALVLTPFTPPGIPILAASAGALLGLRYRREPET